MNRQLRTRRFRRLRSSRPGLWGHIRRSLAQLKADLRVPLAGREQRSRFGRVGARLRFLLAKRGWKLVAAVVVYYLIRDTLLYIILPYFFARSIVGCGSI